MRDTAGVRMCLNIGHRKSYDGTKMSYQKDTEDKYDRSLRTSNKTKTEEIQEIDRKASKKSMRRRRINFHPDIPKGWQRIESL